MIKLAFKYLFPILLALALAWEGIWYGIVLLNQPDDLMIFLGTLLLIFSFFIPMIVINNRVNSFFRSLK